MAVNVVTIDGLATAYHTLKVARRRGSRLERFDRARNRADGPAPIRVDRADFPAGRDQTGWI